MTKIDPGQSIQTWVVPKVKTDLLSIGYSQLKIERSDGQNILVGLTAIATLIGRKLAKHVSIAILEGSGSSKVLPVHTESIYCQRGICPIFALGCVHAASSGGNTRIYDGRKAACILRTRAPAIATTRIIYSSLGHTHESAEYSLIHVDANTGDVLRFRSRVATNKMTLSNIGVSEDEVYNTVNNVLKECIILDHQWNPGDLLFVNNRITLHDRLPYAGRRVLIRLRFDDPMSATITY